MALCMYVHNMLSVLCFLYIIYKTEDDLRQVHVIACKHTESAGQGHS